MLLNFVKLGGLQLSGKTISWVIFSWVGIILDGNFLGIIRVGVILGGSYPGWKLSWVGIFFDVSFPGGNRPVGIIMETIFQVEVFVLYFKRSA